MTELKNTFKKQVYGIAEKIVEEKLECYDNVRKAFSPFFCSEGLSHKLNQKVDNRDFDKMNEEKASKK